jgi:hypothetical protein
MNDRTPYDIAVEIKQLIKEYKQAGGQLETFVAPLSGKVTIHFFGTEESRCWARQISVDRYDDTYRRAAEEGISTDASTETDDDE